jgi:hypothetical protein
VLCPLALKPQPALECRLPTGLGATGTDTQTMTPEDVLAALSRLYREHYPVEGRIELTRFPHRNEQRQIRIT